jgi:hypothetical protein
MVPEAFNGRFMYGGVIREPQIVVGTEVQDGALSDPDFGILRSEQLSLALIEPGGSNVGQLLIKHFFKRGVRHVVIAVSSQRSAVSQFGAEG